jgi:uncharacterized protein YndB with AHSA1/START domain
MTHTTTDLTVRKQVRVPVPLDEAFALFTTRIATWWPTETHAPHDDVVDLVFEPRVGGELYEVRAGGQRERWATVVAYEPPDRVVLEWHVSTPAPPYTEIEVRFSPEGEGTRVELEHRGWERLLERGVERAASYDAGWDVVLSRFVDRFQKSTSIWGV